MQYYQYFRLKGPPFQAASPNTAVYFSPTHIQGLSTLESGLSGELTGLTMLTGEAGTGKTTLIYALLQRDYKRVRVAHVDDPKLSFPEIMRVVLSQLNLYSTGTTKLDYLDALDRFLKLRGKEERIALIVDEAQLLSDDVLEELRLLSGHGQRHDLGLQLILVGHPELAERLKKPELRQLNQRISSRGVLKTLTYQQAVKYVECRLSAQGGKISSLFEPGALKQLLRKSDGIPRKINMLCHTAMEAAYSNAERKVSYKTARKVASEYHDSVSINRDKFPSWLKPALIGAAFSTALLMAVAYPRVWSGSSDRNLPFGGKIASAAKEARQAKHDTADKPGSPVNQASAGSRPSAQTHQDTAPKAQTVAAVAPHPVEQSSSNSQAATSPAVVNGNASLAPAQEKRDVTPAIEAPPGNTAAQKPLGAPELASHRGQISVRYGDTLEKIAIRYLGSKDGLTALLQANPQVKDINQLSVGEVIYLPPGVSPKPRHDETAFVRPATGPEETIQDPSDNTVQDSAGR
jgi:type II secretory pathway predicted ATPase ExeA/LysM repeat protein